MTTANPDNQISVHQLTNQPTQLWQRLKVKQNKQRVPPVFPESEKESGHVRFVLISDTHNHVDLDLPPGDVLIHTGDFTNTGTPVEIEKFNDYLGRIRDTGVYKDILVIAGNHEVTFEPDKENMFVRRFIKAEYQSLDPNEMKRKLTNCTFIENNSVEVMGFKIYGSPWQPEFGGWAYNLPRGQACLDKWNNIPSNTDILLTHGPPLGYGDMNRGGERCGCAELLTTVQKRVKPMLHVFGHIHEDYGIWTDGTTTFVNASTCTLKYRPTNPPVIIDLQLPN